MNKLITVFTPTYNRAHLLHRGYEALLKQKDNDFLWMIVDDGSTDNTEELVNSWIKENKIEIRYIKKENGGVGTAYLSAINNCDTELMIAIDSDDYLPEDGIEIIKRVWKKKEKYDNVVGIVAIDKYFDGRVVGDLLPDVETVNLIDLLTGKYKINNGDRTDVVLTSAYREAINDSDYNDLLIYEPHNIHLIMSRKYDFLVCNECLKYIEYQPDGLTNTLYKRYIQHADNFAAIRLLYLSFENTGFMFKFKTYLHFIAECVLGKNYKLLRKAPNFLCIILLFIPGWLLAKYIIKKA